jgi:hypothetical protein
VQRAIAASASGLLRADDGDGGVIFGAVTFACLVVSMTLALYGHRPALMLAVAVACAFVFVRHGDGRSHSWAPAAAEDESARRRGRS